MNLILRKKLHLYLLILFLIATASCAKQKFEPDPEDERLPEYTEKGNDVAGALVNGFAWRSDFINTLYYSHRGIKIQNNPGDTLSVQFLGSMNEGIYKGESLNFEFLLPNTRITSPEEAQQLQGRIFVLDSTTNLVSFWGNNNYFGNGCSNGTGELHIKHVELREDGKDYYSGFVISGIFYFTIKSDCANMQVSEGRFDHYVSNYGLF